MLAYASRRPLAERRPAPNAMLGIIAAHVAALAAVMSSKMDLPARILHDPIVVDLIHDADPPPPDPVAPKVPQQPSPSTLDQPDVIVPTQPMPAPSFDSRPVPLPDLGPIAGPGPGPNVEPGPTPAPVRIGARLATSPSELRPPYPATKLASGEEAVLKLRLAIDERGRVLAVEPVGPADPAFLQAARRHMLAHWRYRPASEDGRPIATSIVVTLRFELEA